MLNDQVTGVLVPAAFVAVTVTVVVRPMAVGMPEISPVEVFTERPAGKPVTL